MDQWIEEFLFRGRPPSGPGSEMPREFQVIVQRQYPNPANPDGPPLRDTSFAQPMTPAQAESAGLTLATLVEGINAEAIDEIATLRGELKRLAGRCQDATDLLQEAEAALNAALADQAVLAGEIEALRHKQA